MMSGVPVRATDPRARPVTRPAVGGVVTGVGLVVLAVALFGEVGPRSVVPLSWARPPVTTLALLPGAPVLGSLLAWLASGARDDVDGRRLASRASRWSLLWAGTTAAWTVVTVAGLYGFRLGTASVPDNLWIVVAASDAAMAQLAAVWVALVAAFLAPRLRGPVEVVGLLLLCAAALIASRPAVPASGHGDAAVPLVAVAADLQLVGLLAWLGLLVVILGLGTPGATRGNAARAGSPLTVAALVTGAATVLAGTLRPGEGRTPPAYAVAQLLVVVLLSGVGRRHRHRFAAAGGGPGRLPLVTSEIVLLGTTLVVAVVLPLPW